jgi:hypothetical protein
VVVRRTADGDVVEAHATQLPRWRVLYAKLGPWARVEWNAARLDVRGESATVPLTLARGERLWAAVEYDDASLGCPVRLVAERLEAP